MNNTFDFIGTGGAFSLKFGNTAAIFYFNNTNLLIDCGHTVPGAIERRDDLNCGMINNIFITHIHGDHIGGLEELGFRNRYINKGKKANLFIPTGIEDRLRAYLNATMKYTSEGISKLEDYFNVFIVNEKFTINDYTFRIEEVEHIPGAKSYMLVGNNFIYTGDTQFIDWTKWDLTNIEYIFQDTSLGKYPGLNVHAPLPDLLTLPQEIKNKIYCMHYSDNINDFINTINDSGMHVVNIGALNLYGGG